MPKVMRTGADFNNQRLQNLASPSASTDATNKNYVDNLVAGLSYKNECRVATTANITIATALNSGDTIDGVTLADDDRVLVKDQSTQSTNGIYVVSSSPARATDADSSAELNNATVYVTQGTVN